MKKGAIEMEDFLYEFYRKASVGAGRTPERVMGNMLFQFAEEFSL